MASTAPDRAAVDAVYAAARAAGADTTHAPPPWTQGEGSQHHPGCHGVFLRDLDGHDVEAVCHR